MPRGEKRSFECLLCKVKYSKHSVEEGDFYVATSICKSCYRRMQELPASVSCFGKLPSKGFHGYNSHNLVCSSVCPDRRVCLHFTTNRKLKRTK
jgi:hypothetical protein